MLRLEELADMIVAGRNREAYAILREAYDDLPTWEVRRRVVEARDAPDLRPVPSPEEVIARHIDTIGRLYARDA